MHLRSILRLIVLLVLVSPGQAAELPYRVSLVGDAYDGRAWHTGVRIELDDGWKTYWRMPGESGVPPEFTWTPSEPAHVELRFPTPSRYADQSGETIGYEHEVIFPVTVEAGDVTRLNLNLQLFFAVCKNVCIPAKAEAAIELGSGVRDPLGAARVEEAVGMLPRPGNSIRAAAVRTNDGKPVLELSLDARVDDIFIEGTTPAYFRRPHFSPDGLTATLAIDNIASAERLKGERLTVTTVNAGGGLEQTVTLP